MAEVVIPLFQFSNLIAHHVEDDSNGEENHTENAKSEHCAHGGGHRSPGRKCLLLELRLFEFFNLFPDLLLLVGRYVHFK